MSRTADEPHASPRSIRSVHAADVAGKRVLVRADPAPGVSEGTIELIRARGAASIDVCTTAAELAHAPTADLFVQDSFGSLLEHSPTVRLPSYAGLAIERELLRLEPLLGEVERPFVLVVGGARDEQKLRLLENVAARADRVLAGGRVAERLRVSGVARPGVELPSDVVAAPSFAPDAKTEVVAADSVPYGWAVLDIGPETRELFAKVLTGAATVFWTGPVGVYEWAGCSEGTRSVAAALAASDAYSVVAGAASLRALDALGQRGSVTWRSHGGDATLALVGGAHLPGLGALVV